MDTIWEFLWGVKEGSRPAGYTGEEDATQDACGGKRLTLGIQRWEHLEVVGGARGKVLTTLGGGGSWPAG